MQEVDSTGRRPLAPLTPFEQEHLQTEGSQMHDQREIAEMNGYMFPQMGRDKRTNNSQVSEYLKFCL